MDDPGESSLYLDYFLASDTLIVAGDHNTTQSFGVDNNFDNNAMLAQAGCSAIRRYRVNNQQV